MRIICVFQEFFMPIYFSALLAAIRLAIKPSHTPAIPSYPSVSMADVSQGALLHSRAIAVYPNSTQVQLFMENVTRQIPSLSMLPLEFFLDGAAAEAAYSANTSRYWAGVEFKDPTLQSGAYMMRMAISDVPTEQTGLFTIRNSTINLLNLCSQTQFLVINTVFGHKLVTLHPGLIRWSPSHPNLPLGK